MDKKSEPWYIHAGLYVIIAILAYILIRVAIIDPTDYIQKEKYYRTESQARMDNIRQAEILWEKQKDNYTDNLDSLIYFLKTDSTVHAVMTGVDTFTNRSTNPFEDLANVKFNPESETFAPESLFYSPKSHSRYILQVDTTTSVDTVINKRGKIVRVDTNIVIGSLYYVECPDGYGTIGDLKSKSLKNTASWE